MILLIYPTLKNQIHPIWLFVIKLINPWYVTQWLIDWLIDGLMDWLNGKSNLFSNASQSDSIHSDFIAVIFKFSSLFLQWSVPILWGKTTLRFKYQYLYCFIYLLNTGFTNVKNYQISIDWNHSIVSLSNPIILIIRSNQFTINIEQILIQSIIWLILVTGINIICERSICDR